MNLFQARIGRRARRALLLGAAGTLALLASVALAGPGGRALWPGPAGTPGWPAWGGRAGPGAPPGCAGADPRPFLQGRAAPAAATLCLINEERARQGLFPLHTNRRLGRAATGHARE